MRRALINGEAEMIRTFYHCSSFRFSESEGEQIVLIPGAQSAQGKGVYLSESAPDSRAADSVKLNGLKTVFILSVDAAKNKSEWFWSKGGNDRKKERPKTWHTKGACLAVDVIKKTADNGIVTIYGTARRVA
jgi:hypothetical protein